MNILWGIATVLIGFGIGAFIWVVRLEIIVKNLEDNLYAVETMCVELNKLLEICDANNQNYKTIRFKVKVGNKSCTYVGIGEFILDISKKAKLIEKNFFNISSFEKEFLMQNNSLDDFEKRLNLVLKSIDKIIDCLIEFGKKL